MRGGRAAGVRGGYGDCNTPSMRRTAARLAAGGGRGIAATLHGEAACNIHSMRRWVGGQAVAAASAEGVGKGGVVGEAGVGEAGNQSGWGGGGEAGEAEAATGAGGHDGDVDRQGAGDGCKGGGVPVKGGGGRGGSRPLRGREAARSRDVMDRVAEGG